MRDLSDMMVQGEIWGETIERVIEDDVIILLVTFGEEGEDPDNFDDPGPPS